ncbi:MAG: penicillin acylase family protein [Comamonadaceae bacterium]|nr:MAG: penicillin acylase family protein [Comamonadaceae bacterium]
MVPHRLPPWRAFPQPRRLPLLLLNTALALLVLVAIGIGFYIYKAFPQIDGELRVTGLGAPVTVARDDADITHIRAASARDAWFTLGFVHAQERGWQLEFNRRVMHGELSEVLGEGTLDTDKLLRTLGIARAAQQQWDALPADGKAATEAYSAGVNAFYADTSQALPPEFHILGVKPGGASGRAWTPQDSVGWLMMMALDLGGNWSTEFARLTLSKELETAQLWELLPPYPGELPASRTDFHKLYAGLGIYRDGAPVRTSTQDAGDAPGQGAQSFRTALADSVNAWASGIGENEGKGSNNWVVAGTHTRSGKPLMANDPHLGLSAPAVWYFAHLQTTADAGTDSGLDVIGATLPGLPFVVLGRTRQAAWSFTNTNPDVQDLYLEQLNPANPQQYRVPGGSGSGKEAVWADFKTRPETIKVKGKPDVVITVRETRHGPVLSDVQKAHGELLDTRKFVVALRFAALDADNQTLMAGLRVNRAQSVDAMLDAFSAYHSPMQSVLVADSAGQTAFKAVGKVPLRRADNDIRGIAPSPGWDARYDWSGWLPYSQTPQTGDAAITRNGWLATANQRITPPGYPYFIGQDWTVPYRHDRIDELLDADPQHDLASMRAIQGDQHSEAAVTLLPYLGKALEASKHPLAADTRLLMKGFDGDMRSDAGAPLVFTAWADQLTRGVIGGRIGENRFRGLYGKRHLRSAVEGILQRNDRGWCGAQGCEQPSLAALDRALDRLEKRYGAKPAGWRWGAAHVALSAHKPFTNVPVLAKLFDVRIPTGGDTFTVNVGQYWDTGDGLPFASRQAASMRAVYDLADLEKSVFIYQTGQSGLVFSGRYRDMSNEWANVSSRPMRMDPPGFRHQLVLKP